MNFLSCPFDMNSLSSPSAASPRARLYPLLFPVVWIAGSRIHLAVDCHSPANCCFSFSERGSFPVPHANCALHQAFFAAFWSSFLCPGCCAGTPSKWSGLKPQIFPLISFLLLRARWLFFPGEYSSFLRTHLWFALKGYLRIGFTSVDSSCSLLTPLSSRKRRGKRFAPLFSDSLSRCSRHVLEWSPL